MKALNSFSPTLINWRFLACLVVIANCVVPVLGENLSPTEGAAKVDVNWIANELEGLEQLYRQFHQQPELSFQEVNTARKMAAELKAVGAKITTGIGGHGVVGLLANGDGPTLMLRADLDALPVTEKTNLVYASTVTTKSPDTGTTVGIMHACGHDIHMTNLVGVARYLAEHKQDWSGTIIFIGQPAEERGAGAKAMLEDGLFDRFPKPDYALALHVDASRRTGDIAFVGGFQQANVDSMNITIKGRGGHGAYPHTAIDPVVQAAHVVVALQTIVSREIDPIEPAVVTVGSIHGGTKHNVIGDECRLQLTVRSYSPKVRTQLHDSIRRIAVGTAKTFNAPEPEIILTKGTPSLYNDPDLSRRLRAVLKDALGGEHVHESTPSMGGEDFSRYGKEGVPIVMFRLGVVNERRLQRFETLGQSPPSLHSALFYPDAREALKTGIQTMAACVQSLLPAKGNR